MELSAHNVVVVSSKDSNGVTALPIPDSHGLVIGSRDDPWVLVVEESGTNVVKMSKKSENASLLLVIPHFNLIVISSRHKNRLIVMEADSSNWSIMFIELVE